MFTMVNMSSLPDDRTARARIRDEALRLFAERSPDGVTVRDVAAAAGVSPALVLRHYGSKDGLREAVDEHVAQVFQTLLGEVIRTGEAETLGPGAVSGLAELIADRLSADSPVPGYLGRMLISGGPVGVELFRRLHQVSREGLAAMADAGIAAVGADPEVRAAVLLVNDLALLILRDRVRDVLGVDPLSAAGMRRWGAEVLSIYRDGLSG